MSLHPFMTLTKLYLCTIFRNLKVPSMDRFLQVAFILEGVIRYHIEKGYKWRIRVKWKFKGGLISERFSLLLKSPKQMPNHFCRYIVFRGVIWHLFLECKSKWKPSFNIGTQFLAYFCYPQIKYIDIINVAKCWKDFFVVSFHSTYKNTVSQ